MPLANYSPAREGPDRVGPMLAAEIGAKRGIELVDAGRVEAVLEREPWLLLDRIPPDLVDRFGKELGADALLIGSILSYGYREVLWSAVHSRDGADGEWLFGMGRVLSLEQLATRTLHEMLTTMPAASDSSRGQALARRRGT
jgi:hypothetical protein